MNLELLTQNITTFYITATNTVVPVAYITLNSIYSYILEFVDYAWQTFVISAHTFVFIENEAFRIIHTYLTFTEKILLVLCVCNFIAFFVSGIESLIEQNKNKDKIEAMEKQINYLKSSEKMRETCEQLQTEEFRNMINENNKKFKDIKKILSKYNEELDEQTKFMNEYQQIEQIIFQKMAQMSKELRKMKKEIEIYA